MVALLGLFPVLLPTGLGVATVASRMKTPVGFFLASLTFAVVAQFAFSWSAHSAAWGKVAGEVRFRTIGVVLLLVGTLLFAAGAITAVDVAGQPVK